jgi:hypothetical protein
VVSASETDPTETLNQPSDRWSTPDLNTVPDNAPPAGLPPRQRKRAASAGSGERSPMSTALGDNSATPEDAALVPLWPKIIRISEPWTVTEKIDGTHAILVIRHASSEKAAEPGVMVAEGPGGRTVTVRAASRTRWLVPEHLAREGDARDNFAFATWVAAHAIELALLGPGNHHGEWYGAGIGRGYGLTGRRFALFDTARWQRGLPAAVPEELGLVPVLAECEGAKLNATVARCLARLAKRGSQLVPGAGGGGGGGGW